MILAPTKAPECFDVGELRLTKTLWHRNPPPRRRNHGEASWRERKKVSHVGPQRSGQHELGVIAAQAGALARHG
jgi:hypothetical protein